MVTRTVPYADPGRAAFEELDTWVQNFLLAGSHPELAPAYPFPLPLNANYPQFAVLGLNGANELIWATDGQDLGVAATGTLTLTGVGTANETVTIGDTVYKLVAAPAAAYEVAIGASATATAANLAAAINGANANTPANPIVSATSAAAVLTVTARVPGAGANQVATTETSAAASFGAATLTGGVTPGAGGVRAVGVLAHAASRGGAGSPPVNGQLWYSGCFNHEALVWDASFNTYAKKQAAFRGSPSPTNIIIDKR
ncbi:hypothetical protein [Rhizobium wenxiniae]|uniref:hypothetical protein n=1 Tax=Rhizobium wenxiniae TaxID=1737357 RepID=UPI003C158D2D